jgi:hypothetical protein
MRTINGHDYYPEQLRDPSQIHPQTGLTVWDSLVDDFWAELGTKRNGPPLSGEPDGWDREFTTVVSFAIPIKGVKFRTEPAVGSEPAKFYCQFAYLHPAGGWRWLEVMVPEQVRQQLKSTTASGDDLITALYTYAKADVDADFALAWNFPAPPEE